MKSELLLITDPQAARKLFDQIGPPPATTDCRIAYLLNGSFWLLFDNRYGDARSLLDQARTLAAGSGDDRALAEIEAQIAVLARRASGWESAEPHLWRSIQAAHRARDSFWESAGYQNLGNMRLDQERYDESIAFTQQGSRIVDPFPEVSLSNEGRALLETGFRDDAKHLFQQSDDLSRRHRTSLANLFIQMSLGSLATEAGDTPTALKYLTPALEAARRAGRPNNEADVQNRFAELYLRTGDLVSARRAIEASLALVPQMYPGAERPEALILYGEILLSQRDARSALPRFEQAIPLAEEGTSLRWRAEDGLARSLALLGDLEQADRHYRSAVGQAVLLQERQQKDESKIGLEERLIAVYQHYVEFLIAQNRSPEALSVADSSRARLLRQRGTDEAVLSLTRLQARLAKTKELALSYWLAEPRSFLWIITAEKVRLVELPPESTVRPLVETIQKSILDLDHPEKTKQVAGYALAQVLLAPALDEINRARGLILVPSGVLHGLSWGALPSPGEPRQYLIQKAPLAIAPSLATVEDVSQKPVPPMDEILLVAASHAGSGDLPDLPFAREEIRIVEKRLPASRAVRLEGREAILKQYRAQQLTRFGLIHFASHATPLAANPLDSAILLDGTPLEYKLYAREVLRRPLHANLVTISACRSAGTRVYPGEGLVGLAWAFLRSGSRYVVAGLWDVDDSATANLMDHLYANVASGVSYPEALRQAKIEIINEGGPWSKPYYWAPFIVFGTN